MIGKITGIIEKASNEVILLDVNGVGYEIFCNANTVALLPDDGEKVTIYTDLMVREDLFQLVGFRTPGEKVLYRELLTVQGVGAKAALSILGFIGLQQTIQAISLEDHQSLKAAPFVGPKSAQRIVLELKGKIGKLIEQTGGNEESDIEEPVETKKQVKPSSKPKVKKSNQKTKKSSLRADALSALLNLGYPQGDAAMAIAHCLSEESEKTVEDIIRESLQLLATR